MSTRGGNQLARAGEVCEAYLATREAERVIDDDVLRAATMKALHPKAPPIKLVALCRLVVLLDRR